MPADTRLENGKMGRVKEATKTILKRFGPLLLTGLAAVVEHHWLNHDDDSSEEPEDRKSSDELEERNTVRKLEREVAHLKRSLSRKAEDEGTQHRSSPRIREEIVREWRSPYQEEQVRDRDVRGRQAVREESSPGLYQQSQQIPPAQSIQVPPQMAIPAQHAEAREVPIQYAQAPERDLIRPSQRQSSIQRRRRRHRHSSVPSRSFYEKDFEEAKHAGKVAVIAGAAEAILVDGEWIGSKGIRVGTTMAASYTASRSRHRDPDNFRGSEVVLDAGTGLLVSRLVYGSSRRLEEDRKSHRERRWSHCY